MRSHSSSCDIPFLSDDTPRDTPTTWLGPEWKPRLHPSLADWQPDLPILCHRPQLDGYVIQLETERRKVVRGDASGTITHR
jgi:hypothetical protein